MKRTCALESRPWMPEPGGLGRKHQQQTRKHHMKKIIITLACAAIAPFAFAQTSTTTTEQTTTTQPATTTETTTTYSSGTVTTYEPNKTIVVKSEQGPVSFALGTAARIVDGAGKIVTAPLRSGQKVRVYYTGTGEKRVVERVQVED
jgi:hypothetical protein